MLPVSPFERFAEWICFLPTICMCDVGVSPLSVLHPLLPLLSPPGHQRVARLSLNLNFPLCLPQVAGEQKYHPECFTCLNCRTFIGDGDTYALVERSKLYWWGRRQTRRFNVQTSGFCLFFWWTATRAADEKHEFEQLSLGLRDSLSQCLSVSYIPVCLSVWHFWKWVAW